MMWLSFYALTVVHFTVHHYKIQNTPTYASDMQPLRGCILLNIMPKHVSQTLGRIMTLRESARRTAANHATEVILSQKLLAILRQGALRPRNSGGVQYCECTRVKPWHMCNGIIFWLYILEIQHTKAFITQHVKKSVNQRYSAAGLDVKSQLVLHQRWIWGMYCTMQHSSKESTLSLKPVAWQKRICVLENFKQNKKHVSEHQNVNNSNFKDTNVKDTLLIKNAQNIHSEIELLQKHVLVMVYSY